jgi:hypothetical protein
LVGWGKQHGYGEFTWHDGHRVYEGDYCNGRMHGKGIIEWDNGDTWQGEFNDDELQGLGLHKSKAGGWKRWSFYNQSRQICWRDGMCS